MAKILYVKKRFNRESTKIIQQANAFIEAYQAENLTLTLRQLYYRFVAGGIIPNKHEHYKKLGRLVNEARLSGLIDWDAIIDRTRALAGFNTYATASAALERCKDNFYIDRHATQENRIEVWVEKDALAGVVEKACGEFHIDFFSCRGYTSQTELHGAAMRHKYYTDNGQNSIILHLGDHDPSGKDMTRDIAQRFKMFGVEVDIQRIALNMDQIKSQKLPHNPAKQNDSRFKAYQKKVW